MAPLRSITGGALFIYGNGKSFTLETKDFAIQFALSDVGSFRMPLAASAGDTLNLSAMLAGDQTLNMGIVDYRGQVYPQLFFTGVLNFHTTAFQLPADSASPVRIDGKYTLDGNLQAFTNNPFNGPPGPAVFDYRLKGSAKSTIRFGPTTGPFRSATSYFLSFR